MLQYLFFMTRICLADFRSLWAVPVAPFLTLLALRLLLGGGQPCRGLLFILPAAFLAVSLINLLAFSTENLTLLSFVTGLPWLEPGLLFGWLGLLTGTAVAALLPQNPYRKGAVTLYVLSLCQRPAAAAHAAIGLARRTGGADAAGAA